MVTTIRDDADQCPGAEFLGEPLTFTVLAGGALTIAGVWIASKTRSAGAAPGRSREA